MRIGIAGIGFMGWIHWLAWKSNPDVEVTALFALEPERRAGDWTGIKGNFGPPGEQVDLTGIQVYDTLAGLFADKSVDVFDICLPPGIHAKATVDALATGRDVFCEKPMALHLEDCDTMLAAARSAKRKLLIGHVLPFFPEYAFARRCMNDGTYGRLLSGNFLRTISNPTWINGFFDPEKCGGPLIDLLIHDAHFIRTSFGMPTSVMASGRLHNELVEFTSAQFQFGESDEFATCTGGIIQQQGRPFRHAFELHFEQATLHFDFAALADGVEHAPLKVLMHDGSVTRPDLGDGDPVRSFEAELREVHAVMSGAKPQSDVLDGQFARDAIRISEAIASSVRERQPVAID